MAKERIRKIAKRMQVSVEDVVSALAKLGLDRYQRPNDMLPDAVTTQVEQVLKKTQRSMPTSSHGPARHQHFDAKPSPSSLNHHRIVAELPSEIADDPTLNAALQEYRAAQSLAKLDSRPTKTTAKANVRATPQLSTEDMLRQSLGSEIRQRRLLSEALDQTRSELAHALQRYEVLEQESEAMLSQLKEEVADREGKIQTEMLARIQSLEEKATQSRDRIALLELELEREVTLEREARQRIAPFEKSEELLRKDLERIRLRLADEIVARQVAEAQLDRLQRRLKEVQIQAAAPLPTPAPTPAQPTPTPATMTTQGLPVAAPLDEVFEKRGLVESSEIRTALGILLEESSFYNTMELLSTPSPAALESTLRRKLALLCVNCDPPAGALPIRIKNPARCEVCKGRSTEEACDAFLSLCRRFGIKTVNLLGGPPDIRARLTELLAPAVDLRPIEAPNSVNADWAQQVIRQADLTLLWDDAFLEFRVATLFRDSKQSQVIRVVHHGPGGMLRLASTLISARFVQTP